MHKLLPALAVTGALAIAGCASLENAVSFINEPSTLQALSTIEATGAKFICAAASAQAAATAQEKANGVTGQIATDGSLFYFGSSLACDLLGGSVSTAATPVSLKHPNASRGLRSHVAMARK